MLALRNLLKIFKNLYWILGIVFWGLLVWLPTYLLTWKDTHSMRVWMWEIKYFSMMWLDIFLVIFFAIFVWATLYKMKYFSNPSLNKFWFLWGFLWTLVWGCASCSITLASYLGLASIVAFLPYNWLELKILSIFILIYACFSTLKNLETCKIKKS